MLNTAILRLSGTGIILRRPNHLPNHNGSKFIYYCCQSHFTQPYFTSHTRHPLLSHYNGISHNLEFSFKPSCETSTFCHSRFVPYLGFLVLP